MEMIHLILFNYSYKKYIMKQFCVILIFILLSTCLSSQTKNPALNNSKDIKGKRMDKIVTHSIILKCSLHKAFEMFTVNELIESWLTNLAEVEPFVGGKYELFWEPDDRENNSTIGCKVTAIEKDKYISFEWRSPEQFKYFANNADPLTHVVVFFILNGEYTEIHVIHSGWRSTPEWEEARQWQYKAWKIALENLENIFNSN